MAYDNGYVASCTCEGSITKVIDGVRRSKMVETSVGRLYLTRLLKTSVL